MLQMPFAPPLIKNVTANAVALNVAKAADPVPFFAIDKIFTEASEEYKFRKDGAFF